MGSRSQRRLISGACLRLEPFLDLPPSWQAIVFAQRRELELSYNTGRLGEPVALTLRFPVSPGLVKPDDGAIFQRHKRQDATTRGPSLLPWPSKNRTIPLVRR